MRTPHDCITSDPHRRSGRACVRDLRISVSDVLGWLSGGQTPEQVVTNYPELSREDVRACLAYAAERLAHPEPSAMRHDPRAGWADAARRLAEEGDDKSVWETEPEKRDSDQS